MAAIVTPAAHRNGVSSGCGSAVYDVGRGPSTVTHKIAALCIAPSDPVVVICTC
ncbi:hypothetical protein BD311DRAFT_768276 [Dichomitus squalens]|uniref:Uncharacterized protein n=1 Tax=Dichomitus squalens TaxID=114155 RepID=A0A4Q9MBA5_9APHY|nr:hypothetical protein BD311DRAFT_768276 [Dichomitus squalens]